MGFGILGITINNGVTHVRRRHSETELLCNILNTDTQEILSAYMNVEILIKLGFVTPVDEIRNNEFNSIDPIVSSHTSNEPFKIWWTKTISDFICGRTEEYLRHYGPRKLFLSKKSIWEQISIDIYCEHNMNIGWKDVRSGFNLLTQKIKKEITD